jgi:ATP-dependent Lhr-like helicase
MRFIHVARRFGAIARDASLSDLDLDNVIRSFEGSAVFDEALREAQDKDVDIALTAQLLKRINADELEIAVIKGDEVSPIAGIGDAIKHGYELIPPERMHRVILKYVRARLLDESLTFVCANCWQYTAVRRINDVAVNNLKCPECESHLIGALKADESEVRRGIRQSKSAASTDKSKKTSKLVNDGQKSAELIATYGKAALIALAGKGLSVDDAGEIVKKEPAVNEHLIELIIEAEKDILKRRFYRRRKENV